MNSRISALIRKDLSLFFRNRFYALITGLGVVVFIVIYFVMPSSVDEDLDIALHAPVLPPAFELMQQQEGFNVTRLDNLEAMQQAVEDGQYDAGISLPADILEQLTMGLKPQIDLYFPAGRPAEIQEAVTVAVRELAFVQSGQPLAIEIDTQVLGPDLLGDQIPFRDRMRPLLAVMIIMFEILGLANLISDELEQKTARALLVTPMTVTDFFTAKAIMGIGLAYAQAIVFMGVVGGFSDQPLLMLVTLLLGGILVTGAGFLVASVSKDMMSVMAWGVLVILVFAIPGFNVMFPGSGSDWAKIIPSYYLSDTVTQISNYGASWADVGTNLAILAGFNVAILLGGVAALRRKLR